MLNIEKMKCSYFTVKIKRSDFFCCACLFSDPSITYGVNCATFPLLVKQPHRGVLAEGSEAGQRRAPYFSSHSAIHHIYHIYFISWIWEKKFQPCCSLHFSLEKNCQKSYS